MQEWTTIPAVIRRHLLNWIIASTQSSETKYDFLLRYKSRFSDYMID